LRLDSGTMEQGEASSENSESTSGGSSSSWASFKDFLSPKTERDGDAPPNGAALLERTADSALPAIFNNSHRSTPSPTQTLAPTVLSRNANLIDALFNDMDVNRDRVVTSDEFLEKTSAVQDKVFRQTKIANEFKVPEWYNMLTPMPTRKRSSGDEPEPTNPLNASDADDSKHNKTQASNGSKTSGDDLSDFLHGTEPPRGSQIYDWGDLFGRRALPPNSTTTTTTPEPTPEVFIFPPTEPPIEVANVDVPKVDPVDDPLGDSRPFSSGSGWHDFSWSSLLSRRSSQHQEGSYEGEATDDLFDAPSPPRVAQQPGTGLNALDSYLGE